MSIKQSVPEEKKLSAQKVEPLCPVFGECGGCAYQDISYQDELQLKEGILRNLFHNEIENFSDQVLDTIVPSPMPYHYRNRLDLKLLKTKTQEIFIGFSPIERFRVVPIEMCAIARKEISAFIPELKRQASQRLPTKYRNANLVVRSGDNQKVRWGGIGRRSLSLKEEDYFWTEIARKKIFYSLDTFFQANLSILPELIGRIRSLGIFNPQTVFFDLYGGVGLFGICLSDIVKKVVLVEENVHAKKIAQFNRNYHQLSNFEIYGERIEDKLEDLLRSESIPEKIAMIDPPRAGLSDEARETLANTKKIQTVLYLSCDPVSLIRDIKIFLGKGWRLKKIIPFDFFPKTKHIETLVVLDIGI